MLCIFALQAFRSKTLNSIPQNIQQRNLNLFKKLTVDRYFVNNTRQFNTVTNEQVKVPLTLVKELRNRTSAGYNDCKFALLESNLDMNSAILWLKKKGMVKAAMKQDRIASEGLVGILSNKENGSPATLSVLVETNSETDFVSRGETFMELTRTITKSAFNTALSSKSSELAVDTLLKSKLPSSTETVEDAILAAITKLQENIKLRRAIQVSIPDKQGIISTYIHNAQGTKEGGIELGRIAGVVVLESSTNNISDLSDFGHKLAMHIVGFSPKYISREDVPKKVMDAYEEEHQNKMKTELEQQRTPFNPEKVIEDIVLMEQEFSLGYEEMKNLQIAQVLEQQSKKLGSPIKIKSFVRWECGEGIQKKEENFAEEVAKVLSKSNK